MLWIEVNSYVICLQCLVHILVHIHVFYLSIMQCFAVAVPKIGQLLEESQNQMPYNRASRKAKIV
jgi:hypothetical protein